jgi:hypothetical protein
MLDLSVVEDRHTEGVVTGHVIELDVEGIPCHQGAANLDDPATEVVQPLGVDVGSGASRP